MWEGTVPPWTDSCPRIQCTRDQDFIPKIDENNHEEDDDDTKEEKITTRREGS